MQQLPKCSSRLRFVSVTSSCTHPTTDSTKIFTGEVLYSSLFKRSLSKTQFINDSFSSRDVNIITTIDTGTSLLAGFVIFGILGNLAHEIGTDDIRSVVRGGAGLAFISYPDALSKFTFAPQLFSALFFLMLFALGIGSNVGMTSCVMTVLRDQFPSLQHWKVVFGIGFVGLSLGSIFVTPVGKRCKNSYVSQT